MAKSYESNSDNGICTLATNRHFTKCKLGIRPGVESFDNDLNSLMEVIREESPSKRFFLAQRLGHNTRCTVLQDGDLTRDWTEDENSCSLILVRTQEVTDSIIFPKEGVWVEDSSGRIALDADNMVSLIMAADCPGIMIDAGKYIAVIHASLKVLHNDQDSSSGLLNAMQVLLEDLDIPVEDIKASASYGIGPELYKFSLTHEKWGDTNRERHERLQSLFGLDSAVERDGESHVDLMEIIKQQLLGAGLTEDQIHLDQRCTASRIDEGGDFLFPSNARRDVPKERFAVCRWI